MEKKEFTFNEKTHRYFLDGKPLTGVTTVLGVIAKPMLIPWAAKMTAQHIRDNCKKDDAGNYLCSELELEEARKAHNTKKVKAADFGTVVHDRIEGYVKHCIENNGGAPVVLFDFDLTDTGLTEKQNERIAQSLHDFVNWVVENVGTFIESEARLYSEKHWYAGTVDIIYKDPEGNIWVADVKTSGAVYPEYFAQMGGYDIAYQEMFGEHKVYGYVVLRLDKEKGDIEPVGFNDTELCREMFLHALGLYRILNNIKI